MKRIIKYTLLALVACNQPQSKELSTDYNMQKNIVDTTVVLLDSSISTMDTMPIENIKNKKPVKIRERTIDEIADSRYPNSSRLIFDNNARPLTQKEIEEDEFYEEYIRLRDQKRKAKAHERARRLLNEKY